MPLTDHTPSDNAASPWVKKTQVLIIGSGISGLFTAIKLAESKCRVLIVTKNALSENNSRYAQGGIAAVLPDNSDDSIALHVEDTLNAGAGLCEPEAVEHILRDGFTAISELLLMGIAFDTEDDSLALTLEGGHSVRRILHAGGDATGKQVEMALLAKVNESPYIDVIEYCEISEFITDSNRVTGCQAVCFKQQTAGVIQADYTILATGGSGSLFSQTTNPKGATGNGFTIAYQAGAVLKDMEFMQFHPTAFYQEGNAKFLVSEAVRGEGGILRNATGQPFTMQYDSRADLAPRDIVTRAIFSEIAKTKAAKAENTTSPVRSSPLDHVWLDVTHLSEETIQQRFPNIVKACHAFGVDLFKEWIPVAPAAHYTMGGVAVDIDGRSSLENVYVVGETVWTGLHGANRLASNSLLECLVLARNAAKCISVEIENASPTTAYKADVADTLSKHSPAQYEYGGSPFVQERLEDLHRLMWLRVGVVRDADGLKAALEQVKQWQVEAKTKALKRFAPAGIDYVNQLLLAEVMITAVQARTESRGAHYRTDYPKIALDAMHSVQQRNQPVKEAAVGVASCAL